MRCQAGRLIYEAPGFASAPGRRPRVFAWAAKRLRGRRAGGRGSAGRRAALAGKRFRAGKRSGRCCSRLVRRRDRRTVRPNIRTPTDAGAQTSARSLWGHCAEERVRRGVPGGVDAAFVLLGRLTVIMAEGILASILVPAWFLVISVASDLRPPPRVVAVMVHGCRVVHAART